MGLLLALSGVVPAVVLMGLVSRFDAKRPEPASALKKVALWGGLSTLPVMVVELVLSSAAPDAPLAHALYTAFIVAAVTEECGKAIVMYATVWSLGFALVENVLYLLSPTSTGGFVGIFVARAVLAVPSHAIYAGFMGYWAARRRFDGVGPGLLGGLVIAVLLHGTYDGAIFLAVEGQEALGGWVVLLFLVPLMVVFWGYRRLRRHADDALRLDDAAHARAEAALEYPFGAGFLLRSMKN